MDRRALPNAISLSRLALLPVLWGIALVGATQALAIGIALVASTDWVDGLLARTMHWSSRLGSRLDSIADHLLTISAMVWVAMLRPAFLVENAPVLIPWAVLGALTLAVGWIRFHKFGDVHLYSAKVAMVVGYLFLILLFFRDSYDPRLFAAVAALGFVAVLETLAAFLIIDHPNERIGSILLRRRQGSRPS